MQEAYERLLDETSVHVVQEQEDQQQRCADIVPTEFMVGGYVLLVYPPSKLAARWAGLLPTGKYCDPGGPYRWPQKVCGCLTPQASVAAPGIDVKAVAAADMGEAQVQAVRAHRGTARHRKGLEFEIQWTDGDVTWESWERVKRLAAVDDYIREDPRKGLKALLAGK